MDHVLPDVTIRQWVLSLPFRLRYLAAWDHELCRAVAGVYVRAVLGFLRARARRTGVADGRGGAVVIVQRFGGAPNLSVHLHALVIDGVFARSGDLFAERIGGVNSVDVQGATVESSLRALSMSRSSSTSSRNRGIGPTGPCSASSAPAGSPFES